VEPVVIGEHGGVAGADVDAGSRQQLAALAVLGLQRDRGGLEGIDDRQRGVAPGVMMTSWSSMTSCTGLPSLSSSCVQLREVSGTTPRWCWLGGHSGEGRGHATRHEPLTHRQPRHCGASGQPGVDAVPKLRGAARQKGAAPSPPRGAQGAGDGRVRLSPRQAVGGEAGGDGGLIGGGPGGYPTRGMRPRSRKRAPCARRGGGKTVCSMDSPDGVSEPPFGRFAVLPR
jgi:hypothetical protein